jgi:MoaA/NifB/PqqE/SkfB family radical SAM enzyme
LYDEKIKELVSRPGSHLNISVDAGTPETYKQIKGLDVFEKVFSNIEKYSETASVSCKYIFIPQNSNDTDIMGFIQKCKDSNVKAIILANDIYRTAKNTDTQISMMAKMISLAKENNISTSLNGDMIPEDIINQAMK